MKTEAVVYIQHAFLPSLYGFRNI